MPKYICIYYHRCDDTHHGLGEAEILVDTANNKAHIINKLIHSKSQQFMQFVTSFTASYDDITYTNDRASSMMKTLYSNLQGDIIKHALDNNLFFVSKYGAVIIKGYNSYGLHFLCDYTQFINQKNSALRLAIQLFTSQLEDEINDL